MRLATETREDRCQEMPPERLARDELRATRYAGLQHVECRLSEHRLVLSGTVSSYFLKQLAQSVLRKRFGDHWQIENRLQVVPEEEPPPPYAG